MRRIFVEELYSSHYRRDHGRRLEKCDWIVCWHNDLDAQSAVQLPEIVPLDAIIDSLTDVYVVNRRPSGATQEEYFRFRIVGLSVHHREVIRHLLEFAIKDGLRIEWPETNGACFTVRDVRDGIEYFKVNSNGKIGFPFSPWKGIASDMTLQVAQELNEALNTKWFTGRGKGGTDIMDLMPDDDAVRRFIGIWQKLGQRRRVMAG
jgi:hypothetical protein